MSGHAHRLTSNDPAVVLPETLVGSTAHVARLIAHPGMRHLPHVDPAHFSRRQVQLLVEHRCELSWALTRAVGHVGADPLGDQPPARPGDLLASLLLPDLRPWWEANPGAAEEVRRACGMVLARAADPEPGLAVAARAALAHFEQEGLWPWSPGEALDEAGRWRAGSESPLEAKVNHLESERDGTAAGWFPDSAECRRLSEPLDTRLGELTREQVRLLLERRRGLPWILPLALKLVEADPQEPSSREPGGLLIALLNLRLDVVWRSNPELVTRLKGLLLRLEREAADTDIGRAQGPYALLERLAARRLYPWEPQTGPGRKG